MVLFKNSVPSHCRQMLPNILICSADQMDIAAEASRRQSSWVDWRIEGASSSTGMVTVQLAPVSDEDSSSVWPVISALQLFATASCPVAENKATLSLDDTPGAKPLLVRNRYRQASISQTGQE